MDVPTVASLLPAKVRAWAYALIGLGVPTLLTTDEVYGLGPWVPIVVVAATSAGFGLALSNTTVKAEPESDEEETVVYHYVDATGPQALEPVVEDDEGIEDPSEPVDIGIGSVLR